MLRPAVAFAAALLLAGCSGPSPKTAEVRPAALPGLEGLAVPADNATVTTDTALLLQVASGPDAPLTAYRWPVPAGSFVPLHGSGRDALRFAVVPVGADGLDLQEYALVAVGLGRAVGFLGGDLAVPVSGSAGTMLSQAPVDEPATPLAGMVLTFEPGDLQEGDGIGVAFAARSAAPHAFGLLVAPVLDGGDPDPPHDATALLRGRQALALEPSGRGAGFQLAHYLQAKVFLPTVANMALELRTAAVQVEDAVQGPAEPFATAQDRTLSARFPGRGASYATAFAVQSAVVAGGCPWAGTYEVSTDLHGTTLDSRSILAGAGPTLLPFGLPFVVALGAGDGDAATSLHLRHAAACTDAATLLFQLDLGATPGDLFGAEMEGMAAGYPGLAGNVPPSALAVDGGDLVIEGPATWRLVGAAPGVPDLRLSA